MIINYLIRTVQNLISYKKSMLYFEEKRKNKALTLTSVGGPALFLNAIAHTHI